METHTVACLEITSGLSAFSFVKSTWISCTGYEELPELAAADGSLTGVTGESDMMEMEGADERRD